MYFLPLLTAGVRGYPPAQTRQQRILGMSGVVPSIHGVKPFGVVYINKSYGLPTYNERSDMGFFFCSQKKNRAAFHCICSNRLSYVILLAQFGDGQELGKPFL